MLRTITVALAVAAFVYAQDDIRPEEPRPEEPAQPQPEIEEPHTSLTSFVTGGDHEYTKVVKGDLEQDPLSFRTYIRNNVSYLSYWHDIPLFFDQQNNLLNMVVEIKRGEGLKTAANLREPMNPIMASLGDDDKPLVQFVDYIHSYGFIPQTFVDASIEDSFTQLRGDNTPLDVVEISSSEHEIGDVVPVKIVGVLGVIEDDDTIDYKIIAIDANSGISDEIHTLDDVEKMFPDLLSATRGFFRYYNYPTVNKVAFDGKYQDAETAMKIVSDKHSEWKTLIQSATPPAELNLDSHQPDAAHKANDEAWTHIVEA